MVRSLKFILGVALVAIVAAAAGLWWFVLRDDAPPPAALPSRTTTDGGASGDLAGTWAVQQGTDVFVGYRIQEQFGGDTFAKTAVGRTPAVTGSVEIQGGKVASATINADLTQLSSDQPGRDRYITTHGIETTTFPNATFVLAEPIDVSSATAGSVVKADAVGDLALHGVTKRVTIPLDARWNGDTIDVSGSLEIILADYAIESPNVGGFVSVGDRGTLELQLTLVPATGPSQ